MYEQGGMGYRAIAKELGYLVKRKFCNGFKRKIVVKVLSIREGRIVLVTTPFVGRPRTKFTTVEEERDV